MAPVPGNLRMRIDDPLAQQRIDQTPLMSVRLNFYLPFRQDWNGP